MKVCAFPKLMFPSSTVSVAPGESSSAAVPAQQPVAVPQGRPSPGVPQSSASGAQSVPAQSQEAAEEVERQRQAREAEAQQLAAQEAAALEAAQEQKRQQAAAQQAAAAAAAAAAQQAAAQKAAEEQAQQMVVEDHRGPPVAGAGSRAGATAVSPPPQNDGWAAPADALFDQLDSNHDGVLDRREFTEGIAAQLADTVPHNASPTLSQQTAGHPAHIEHPIQWSSTAQREGRAVPLDYMAKTVTEGNCVIFTFESAVCLERLTITTPGGTRGPAAYSCAMNNANSGWEHLCEGALNDTDGEQDLEVTHPASQERSNSEPTRIKSLEHVVERGIDRYVLQIMEMGPPSRCLALKCEFFPFAGESTFQILQFHIFGTL